MWRIFLFKIEPLLDGKINKLKASKPFITNDC